MATAWRLGVMAPHSDMSPSGPVGGQQSMRLGLGNSDVEAGTEEKVTSEGGWISLGPWGPEGWSRRSRCEASYKADGPVMEITVHYSQLSPVSDTESIDAISFQSKSRDVVVIGCSEIGSSCCQRKVRIDSSVEQLLSISLTYNTFYMTSLTFHTNRNKYGPIGPFDEKDTTFSMPMDVGDIVGFHGCGEVGRDNRLIAIGVFVVPKVKSLHSIQDPYARPSKDKEIEEKRKSKIKELEDKVDELVMKMKEADAKNEVLRKKNEEMEKAELFFTGKQLKDDHKLVDYGIRTNSTFHPFLHTIDRITLLVNIPSNEKTFRLQAKNHETVENIKLLILAKEGILPEQYTLFHCGKLLEDNKTLASLNIKSGSALYLVFNPRDVMSIFVKMPSGEILKFEVKVLHTIHDVKAIIQSMVGFSVSVQKLTYAGNLVEDSKTLACYNIEENSLLEMLSLPFQIFVKDWGGKTTVLNVFKEDRVEDVETKFLNKLGLPVKVHPLYLVFGGRLLEYDRDLASYNIQKDSTLHTSFKV